MTFGELLTSEFAPYGELQPVQVRHLEAHYRLLLKWNTKLNLTRIDTLQEAVRLHYCESLYLATMLPPGPISVVDVGSGGGFPGFPIGVLRPDCSVTLVESHQRKAVFLREATRALSNIKVLARRAEDLEGKFDWVVSRAVTPAGVLGLPFGHSRALLVGAADASRLGGGRKLPWGTDRFLVRVPRETVSRETLPA